MNKLHHLLDTRDKRDVICATIFYAAMFLAGLTQIYLAIQLLLANNYDQVFDLLENGAVRYSFLGKLATSLMSYFSASLFEIIQIVYKSMSFYDWIIVIFGILFLFMKPMTKYEKKMKLYAQLDICLFLIVYLSLMLTLIFSFKMGSLLEVVSLLHILAVVILATGAVMVIMNGYALCWNILVQIPNVMCVTVEEVYEYS